MYVILNVVSPAVAPPYVGWPLVPTVVVKYPAVIGFGEPPTDRSTLSPILYEVVEPHADKEFMSMATSFSSKNLVPLLSNGNVQPPAPLS